MFVGIDVSVARGFDMAALDDDRRLVLLAKAKDLDAISLIVRGLPPESIVAVDAPPAPSRGLVAGAKRFRVAEEELHKIGVSLYPVPPVEIEPAGWMREGFALYEILAKAGFPPFFEGPARRGVSIEVYPHLTYRVLTGSARGRAAKLAWSRVALRRRVAGAPRVATQDQLDAMAAALTGWFFAHDRWVGYGDPREGVIVAPRADDRDEPASGPDQLSLGIDAPHPVVSPLRAAGSETSFAQRVLRFVARVPPGSVVTFGDVARSCGVPAGARAVGTILAAHPFEVPGHRVVDASGRPSGAYPGGPERQLERLAAEGVALDSGRVDLATARRAAR